MEMQTRAQKKGVLDQSALEVRRLISDILNRADPCTSTLAGFRRGDEIQNIFIRGDNNLETPFAVVGQEFRNSKIIIRRMRILNISDEASIFNVNPTLSDVSDDAQGIAYLDVTLEKMGAREIQTFYGGDTIRVQIPFKGIFKDMLSLSALTPSQCIDAWKTALQNKTNEYNKTISDLGLNPILFPVKIAFNEDTHCRGEAYVDPNGISYLGIAGDSPYTIHPNARIEGCGQNQ
jgi:hypothetical protein